MINFNPQEIVVIVTFCFLFIVAMYHLFNAKFLNEDSSSVKKTWEDKIMEEFPYDMSNPLFYQGVLLTREFKVGEEIIVMCMDGYSPKYKIEQATFKTKVIPNSCLKTGYWGVQYVFHGYQHYKEFVESLTLQAVSLRKYENIEEAPNNLIKTI